VTKTGGKTLFSPQRMRHTNGKDAMKSLRTGIIALGMLLFQIPASSAADLSHLVMFEVSSMSGDTTYEITPPDGISRLSWPMDMRLAGGRYCATYRDTFQVELSAQVSPWIESSRFMEDWDWINESGSPDWRPYDELDIHSRSSLDAKAFMLGADFRALPLAVLPFASLGLQGGFHYQEADFRAYDTRQTGYGSWNHYTASVAGPVSTYAVTYQFVHLGAALQARADDRLRLTLEASFIPYARAEDEDNHIRRMRVSVSEATGTGTMLRMSVQYFFTDAWFASTSCSKLRIRTSGDQDQYWYGDDPFSSGFDDTGSSVRGIDVDIEQDTFHLGIALGRRF
jgi:outer membrane protease